MSLFITFEGGEGSGKSYQARVLYRTLVRLAIPVILIHEPGSTPLGERLSRLLKRSRALPISPLSELLLFNACRVQLVNDVIRPALEEGKIVICDRFADSSIAYQGYGRGVDVRQVEQVNRMATGGLKPDLTLLLDLPVQEGLARKMGRASDRFEREALAFHERVRRGYLDLAKAEPRRFQVVDGRHDRRMVASLIWGHVTRRLKRAKRSEA